MSDSESWLGELRRRVTAEYGQAPVVCTLATVDEHGLPAARSVICRRIEATGELLFVSDARSRKNEHLAERPGAEVVFWMPRQRVQFRIAGTIGIVRAGVADSLLAELWSALSDESRALFYWPPEGEPLEGDSSRFTAGVSAGTAPPATFEVLLLRPLRVDVLDITPRPHRRRLHTRSESGWTSVDVNP